MNVAGWLRALGLEQYEAAFRENDVNVDLLPDLTDFDLKELGVTSLGHRRQWVVQEINQSMMTTGFRSRHDAVDLHGPLGFVCVPDQESAVDGVLAGRT